MPKSKRAKVVHLTKSSSKGRGGKSSNILNLQKLCDEYKTIYVFSWENLRTNLIKNLRNKLKDDSRIFMGKNSLIRIAFGKSPDQAYLPGLHEISQLVQGNVGLLFTNQDVQAIEKVVKEFQADDYARWVVEEIVVRLIWTVALMFGVVLLQCWFIDICSV